MGVLHVTTTKQPPYRSRITVRSPWLAGMGFVNGAAVRAVPIQDGFTLSLLNEKNVRERGKLLRVGLATNQRLILTLYLAQNFATTGLVDGDFLAAGYEYGLITAMKLPEAQKYYVMGYQNHGAFLQMSGGWLDDTGFAPDTITTVALTRDGISFTAWNDASITYGEIVKHARERMYQIIQARRNQQITTMDVPGYIFTRAGFGQGDIVGVRYEYGTIQLFKPDLRKLGFAWPAAP